MSVFNGHFCFFSLRFRGTLHGVSAASGKLGALVTWLHGWSSLKIGPNAPKGNEKVFRPHPFAGAFAVGFGECESNRGCC